MKKRVKKLVVIALTVALFVTSVLPALATDHEHHKDDVKIKPDGSEVYTITLTKPSDYKVPVDKAAFGAYQVFKGEVNAGYTPGTDPGDNIEKLPITDIKWGNAFGIQGDTVTAPKDGNFGSDNEKTWDQIWKENVVGFVTALGTAKTGPYSYAFSDFNGFGVGESTPLVDADGYLNPDYVKESKTGINSNSPLSDLNLVNYDKLAVAVAQEVAKHANHEWLQAFADILGGYSVKYGQGNFVEQYYGGNWSGDTYEIKVPAGYYMIIDRSEIDDSDGTDLSEAYSARMLFVAYDITQQIKEDVPELEKKVVRIEGGGETYHESEAAGVGDLVKFRLEGTLPSNYDSYLGGYQYKFVDTLSEGLTLQEKKDVTAGDMYVTVSAQGWWKSTGSGDPEWSDEVITIKSTDFKPSEAAHSHDDDKAYVDKLDGNELTVSFVCLKEIEITKDGATYKLGYNPAGDGKSSKIYVEYTAMVNENAIVNPKSTTSLGGNINTAQLEYSDNPQSYADTDYTTTDNATVYTFGLNIIKTDAAAFLKNDGNVDAAGVALEGAEFALVRCVVTKDVATTYQWQIAKFVKVEAADVDKKLNIPAVFKKNGYYTISEWVDIDDGDEEVFDETWLSKYTGGDYNIATLEGGYLNVSGIDSGVEYTLVETKTPGIDYAKIKPFTVKVTAEIEAGEYNGQLSNVESGSAVKAGESFSYKNTVQLLEPVDGKEVADGNLGSAGMYVANFKYENLPSTGGIGTWIYYIIGGVTVAGALVLFILAGRKSRKAD